MNAFFVAGIGVALFIELLLISKKQKSESDKILTLWMLLILVHLSLFYVQFTGLIYNVPFLLGTEHPLPLLHGVFLYFYVSFLTKQLPERRTLLLCHFVPAAAMYAYLVTFFLLPADEKIQVYRAHGAGYEQFMLLRWYAVALSGIFYVVWSALLLRKHEERIRDQFSDLEKINLHWLQILTFGLGAIWVLVIFFRNDVLVYTGVVIFVFLIGFFGVRQTDIFAQSPPLPDDREEKKKYPKSGLSEESSGTLHSELLRLMTEGAYKKTDLSINDLSSKLGVHPNYLSQVINQKEKKHFYDFVNSYRIEEFRRMIAQEKNQHYTLLSLAFDCGFSSKSSFNRVFKKLTGQTPSEYSSTLARSQGSPA